MPENNKLLAWIEPHADDAYRAAFVGKAAADHRMPAMRLCSSIDDARKWVEEEAAAIDVPVEWLSKPPRR
jgi:hypothetical protein